MRRKAVWDKMVNPFWEDRDPEQTRRWYKARDWRHLQVDAAPSSLPMKYEITGGKYTSPVTMVSGHVQYLRLVTYRESPVGGTDSLRAQVKDCILWVYGHQHHTLTGSGLDVSSWLY